MAIRLFDRCAPQPFKAVERIRGDTTRIATQRAQETATYPDIVGTLQRRFHQQGMGGLILAHQGFLKEQFSPPIPLHVLGGATARLYPVEELNRHFAHDLFPRTTNLYGCVTLHHYHVFVEYGLPTTPVLLWRSGGQLRAVFHNVVVAEYRCHYDGRKRHVTNVREGVFYRRHHKAS